jgi:hypothetical protein
MQDILTIRFPDVPIKNIQTQIRNHLNAVRYAKAHHLEPAPVFRNLYKIVEKVSDSFPRKVVNMKPEVDAKILRQGDNLYRPPKVTHGLHLSKEKLRSQLQIQDENTPPNKQSSNVPTSKTKTSYEKLLNGIKEKNEEVYQLLLFYVKEGNIAAVNDYIDACKNTGWGGTDFPESLSKARDGAGNSALHMIAKSGNMDLWDIIAKSGYWDKKGWYDPVYIFDFTLKNNQGETPLDVAIKAGNVEMVEQMLDVYKKGASYAREEHQAYLKRFGLIENSLKKLVNEARENRYELGGKPKRHKKNT